MNKIKKILVTIIIIIILISLIWLAVLNLVIRFSIFWELWLVKIGFIAILLLIVVTVYLYEKYN